MKTTKIGTGSTDLPVHRKSTSHPKPIVTGTGTKALGGFTLVELIVVITILVILGTIAFIQLGGFASSARDSARVSDMKSIETGLALYNVKSGSYPDPETPVSIEASGIQIGLQGYLGDAIGSLIKMSPTPVDPLDKNKYIYSVNTARTKYQVMGFMEENGNATAFNSLSSEGEGWGEALPTAYAADLSKRFPRVGGDSLGILLDSGTLAPVSGTKIDLITTNSGSVYNAYFGNTASDIITTTGTGIFSSIYNRQPELIRNKTLASLDPNLVGYWDMETLTGTMLKDLSGRGNDGVCYNSGTIVTCGGGSGGPQIVDGNGKSGKAMSFNGVSDYVKIINGNYLNSYISGSITLIVNIKLNGKTGSDHGIINAENRAFCIETGWAKFAQISFQTTGGSSSATSYSSYISNAGLGKSSIDITDNSSHQIVSKYSPNDGLKLIIDGALYNSTSYSGAILSNTGAIFIGKRSDTSLANGLIDEIRIYNRALSDSEIQNLYNATK